jgi:hypothetical protein
LKSKRYPPTSAAAVPLDSAQAAVEVDPVLVDAELEEGRVLRGQVLFVSGASGVADTDCFMASRVRIAPDSATDYRTPLLRQFLGRVEGPANRDPAAFAGGSSYGRGLSGALPGAQGEAAVMLSRTSP